MKEILIIFSIIIIFTATPAYAHKLISHDDSHRDIDNALKIPDHKISWAIYENLGTNEAKFYSFDAKKGDSFYASIVVPKIEGLEVEKLEGLKVKNFFYWRSNRRSPESNLNSSLES